MDTSDAGTRNYIGELQVTLDCRSRSVAPLIYCLFEIYGSLHLR
jgi:hypothetical protein